MSAAAPSIPQSGPRKENWKKEREYVKQAWVECEGGPRYVWIVNVHMSKLLKILNQDEN